MAENNAELANRIMREGGQKSKTYKDLDKGWRERWEKQYIEDRRNKGKDPETIEWERQQKIKKANANELANFNSAYQQEGGMSKAPQDNFVTYMNSLKNNYTNEFNSVNQNKSMSITDRFKNVAGTLQAAFDFNPNTRVESNFGNNMINNIANAGANHPFTTAFFGAGIFNLINSFSGITSATKFGVQPIKKVLSSSTATRIATNSATNAKTASWFAKLASTMKRPDFVIGTLMATIGSYPFAGFIKEEALQTLGFGVKSAIDNNDIAGAEEALASQMEVLNPGIWEQIKAKVPFANVLDQLNNFYEAALIKTAIDKKIIEDKKIQIKTGETETQKWKRIDKEKQDQTKANIDYYNEQRKQQLIWEREAELQNRKEDAKYWANIRAQSEKKQREDAAAIEAYWQTYYKETQKNKDDNRPSNLKFGLL